MIYHHRILMEILGTPIVYTILIRIRNCQEVFFSIIISRYRNIPSNHLPFAYHQSVISEVSCHIGTILYALLSVNDYFTLVCTEIVFLIIYVCVHPHPQMYANTHTLHSYPHTLGLSTRATFFSRSDKLII